MRLVASYPQAKKSSPMPVFDPFYALLEGRIRGLVTPDLSRFIEGAVVRA